MSNSITYVQYQFPSVESFLLTSYTTFYSDIYRHSLPPLLLPSHFHIQIMANKKYQTRTQQKRGTRSTDTRLYQPTDIVLAKVKGYPAWPAMIIPYELVPTNILKSNPRIDLQLENDQDSNPNNDKEYVFYSKVLKFKKFDRLQDSYCVKFFMDDSYIWVKLNDLHKLSLDDCLSWLEKNQSSSKNKNLISAYEMACRGFKAPGIDVWEFVEYGSKNRKLHAGDEEYIDEEKTSLSSNRSSSKRNNNNNTRTRTRSKDRSLNQEAPATKSSTKQKNNSRGKKSEKDDQDNKFLETKNPKNSKSLEKKEIDITEPQRKKVKLTKKNIIKSVKPIEEKYNYEDDEDWSIVGMGPQNYNVTSKVSSIVTKLSQRNKLEEHNEIKLDLMDKLLSINKLLINVNTQTPKQEDFEIILDEFDIILKINGSKNEFISVLRGNSELLINFRILFNLRSDDLHKFGLYDAFQKVFKSIYNCLFIPDLTPWSQDKSISDDSETNDENRGQNHITKVDENADN